MTKDDIASQHIAEMSLCCKVRFGDRSTGRVLLGANLDLRSVLKFQLSRVYSFGHIAIFVL